MTAAHSLARTAIALRTGNGTVRQHERPILLGDGWVYFSSRRIGCEATHSRGLFADKPLYEDESPTVRRFDRLARRESGGWRLARGEDTVMPVRGRGLDTCQAE